MKRKVLAFMKEWGMTSEGDKVCVGLSGGADSVLLLLLLNEMKEELAISLSAMHVNHSYRGEESDGDEAFSKGVCEKLNIPLYIFHVDMKNAAKEKKMTLEEAGRFLRKDCFRRLLEDEKATKIALGHHMDDQAETVLFHAARGTSLSGMAGIRPVQAFLIRPLLPLRRSEIEAELNKRKQSFCLDSSNLSVDFARNKLRHQILPVLSEVNEGTVSHIAHLAEDMALADDLLLTLAKKKLMQYGEEREGARLLKNALFLEHELIVRYAILLTMEEVAGSRKDIGREHVMDVYRLSKKQTGRSVNLPYGMKASRGYEGILLEVCDQKEEGASLPQVVEISGEGVYQFGQVKAEVRILQELPQKIPEKRYTKWFDYDTIKRNLVLRNRKTGDFISIDEKGRKKKLKDYLIDEKVPRGKRDTIPILASGQEVFWVVGKRIGASAKIRKETKVVLEIQITGDMIHEC